MLVDAARFRVLQGAAPKRREAGGKNRARIEQVRILDDALPQGRHRFVEHRQDQAVLEIGRHLAVAAAPVRTGLPSRQR